MRESLVRKSAATFFENKQARVIEDIKILDGTIIKAGKIVMLLGKNYRIKHYLDLEFENERYNSIPPECLQLLPSGETWPIERDTMDLREHEFNFNKK